MTERDDINPLDQVVNIDGRPMVIRFLEGESKKDRSIRLSQKLVARDQLEGLGSFLRQRHKTIAYTSGAYDIIHKGHARYLHLARSLGDVLVVGLNSDQSIQGYKGPSRPILGQEDRAEMLSFLEAVDFITIYDEPTGANVIKLLEPHSYLCVEGSWEGNIEAKAEVIAMSECGGQVFYTPRQNPYSSTSDIIGVIEKKYGESIIPELRAQMEKEEKNGK